MKGLLLFFFTPLFCFSQSIIDDNFRVDQLGYRQNARKVAVIADPQTGYNAPDPYLPGPLLEIRRASDNVVVFTGSPAAWNGGNTHTQSGDRAWWFDFSSFTTPGDYYVNDPASSKRSHTFKIDDAVYNDALKHAVRALYYQRCGMSKSSPYASSQHTDNTSCHTGNMQDLNCRDVTQPNNTSLERDLSGGWHDAGDYNKYTNFCLATVHYLLDAYEQNPGVFPDNYGIPESGNGIPDILDEIKYELDWLLKMQETSGAVLMKVSTQGFTGGSPPSADNAQRFYGTYASSATRTFCSIMAHAAIVYGGITSYQSYAATLLNSATLAWNWLQSNPGFSNYNNSGFSSANPEVSQYTQSTTSIAAAVYLYAATGQSAYRTYVDANYQSVQPYQWNYWYPFESVIQDALLYYTTTPGATAGVVSNIRSNCLFSVNSNNPDLLPAWMNQSDVYMAYMKNQDYVWGNNQFKAETGSIMYNMIRYNIDPGNQTNYRNASEGYIHFFHGVNALNYLFLTKADAFGGDSYVKEIYHGWFGDGTAFDGNVSPYLGPPPGFIPGGINATYQPDGSYTGPPIAPPQNQPVQKSYKDWNTSWPENSWEVTEVGIYVQAAYIKLISKFATYPVITGVQGPGSGSETVSVFPNPAEDKAIIRGINSGAHIELKDITGRTLESFVYDGNPLYLNYPTGVYFILISDQNRIFTEKLILH